MSIAYRFQSSIVAVAVCLAAAAMADESKLPSGATVLDPDVMMYSWPYPIISPEGQWVAYISKGFVCVCNVATPDPLRLFEVPNTWTHFLAQPEQAYAKGIFHETTRGLSRDERKAVLAKITDTVFGLQWTPNGDGVFFGVRSYNQKKNISISDFWYTPIHGTVAHLAHVKKGIGFGGNDLLVTRDRRFLVTPGGKRPLIWDLTTNKPRATCFHYLTPSTTSGRWIGIEKDTRQLVIANEEFDITKRFDVTQPTRTYGNKLIWSPDEQFVIWQNQIGFDHYSNWEGFWMNLSTGEKRKMSGQYMNQKFTFTGHGGEYVRWGVAGEKNEKISGSHSTGAYLTISSGMEEPAKDIWRINQPYHVASGNPPVRLGPQCKLFAIRLPKPPIARPGSSWYLMNREGKTWQFPGVDFGEFYSPSEIIGFADAGNVIVGCDGKRMFSLPVATIMDTAK